MEDSDIDRFIDDLEKWASTNKLNEPYFVLEEDFDIIFNESPSTMHEYDLVTLQDNYMKCLKHLSNLRATINKLKVIVNYCDTSLEYMTSKGVLAMSDVIARYEVKFYSIVSKDKLCEKLFKIGNIAKSKLILIDGDIETKEKFTNILQDIIKKKTYDRSN